MKSFKAALPVFPGFYGTYFEADESFVIEDGKTYDDYNFEYRQYEIDCGNAACQAIENQLKDLGFNCSIQFREIYSPREYNFANDAILATFKLKSGCIAKIRRYVKEHYEAFATYLIDNFKSRSGFISFYSFYPSDWLTYINVKSFSDNEIYLEHLLNFILLNEGYDSLALYYDCDSVYLDGWLKEPETEEPEETDIGALWSYTPILEMFSDFIASNQLKLKL